MICHSPNSNLPSISELWLVDEEDEIEEGFNISDQCPELKVVRIFHQPTDNYQSVDEAILDAFNERIANVKAGLKVDEVMMGNVKTLILPFEMLKAKTLEELKQLVEEVVDIGSVPEHLEIEI